MPEKKDDVATNYPGTIPNVRPEDQAYAIRSKKNGKYNALWCVLFAAIGIVLIMELVF
ncbi:MAG TPA: hypothetical protein VKM55_30025 [Candidatus Lokiarchaeia archaeon]|nr:hypothetical protein [Candidatus Lokiarchaeia archaeon]